MGRSCYERRGDNPATGVRGPDRGVRKAKQFLFPSEFETFVTCAEVPMHWRRIVAVAVFLYPRAGELRSLKWEHVDLEHGVVSIDQAWDSRSKRVKQTKTGITRRVPIEANLLPLLKSMHEAAAGDGPVLDMPSERALSRALRRWLRRSGVTRDALHEDTPTSKAMTFHDLRATGITWAAIRGDDALKIQKRAGHTDPNTTQIYIREAEIRRTVPSTACRTLPACQEDG